MFFQKNLLVLWNIKTLENTSKKHKRSKQTLEIFKLLAFILRSRINILWINIIPPYLNHRWVQEMVPKFQVWIASYLAYTIWISLNNGSPSRMFDRILKTPLESMAPAAFFFSFWRFLFLVNVQCTFLYFDQKIC